VSSLLTRLPDWFNPLFCSYSLSVFQSS